VDDRANPDLSDDERSIRDTARRSSERIGLRGDCGGPRHPSAEEALSGVAADSSAPESFLTDVRYAREIDGLTLLSPIVERQPAR
jgi:hypothetical protein